jgi:hypothetical protein
MAGALRWPFQVVFSPFGKDLNMQAVHPEVDAPVVNQPTFIDLLAGGLLALTVILHIVALFPHYFGGPGGSSLWSQTDQAAAMVFLAGGWALALAIGLSSPARAGLAAGLAVGLAVTEFGFRLSDLGYVFRYGWIQGGPGLWLMTAAWVVGAAGAVAAVLAARRRLPAQAEGTANEEGIVSASPDPDPSDLAGLISASPAASSTSWWDPDRPGSGTPSSWAAPFGEHDPSPLTTQPLTTRPLTSQPPSSSPLTSEPPTSQPLTSQPPTTWPRHEAPGGRAAAGALAPSPSGGETGEAAPPPSGIYATLPLAPSYRRAAFIIVALLAAATAGAFLPAWDRYTGVETATGRAVSFSAGNAFSAPWQVVIGTILVALAIVALPIGVTRLRARPVAAAVVAGSLIVLASQFLDALVQVDQPIPSSILSPAEANQLGLQLHLTLTGWFTVDLVVAFALFAVTMILGYLQLVEAPAGQQVNSTGPWPNVPTTRSPAGVPWS